MFTAHVQTAAFVPASLVAPHYIENLPLDKTMIPFELMCGWIAEFEPVDLLAAILPRTIVCAHARSLLGLIQC